MTKWMILLFETAALIVSCSLSLLQQTGKEIVRLAFWTLILRYAAVQGGERISDKQTDEIEKHSLPTKESLSLRFSYKKCGWGWGEGKFTACC